MKFTKDFGEFLYNRLPQVYRSADTENKMTLYRFIDTLNSGGFNTVIDSLNNLEDVLDIDKTPSKFLPYMANLLGYEYNPQLPEWFQRRLLNNIVTLYKRKGTKSAIKFLARELSGFESEIIENKDFSENDVDVTGWSKDYTNHKNFILKLKAPLETSRLQEKEDAVKLVIEDFLPTNSKVLIITAYWNQEDRDITNNAVEETLVTNLHFDSDVETKTGTTDFLEIDMLHRMTFRDSEDEVYLIYKGEEVSLLNDLGQVIAGDFTTNAYQILDDILISEVEYTNFLVPQEVSNLDIVVRSEVEETYTNTSTETNDSIYSTSNEGIETSDLVNLSTETILDILRLLETEETTTLVTNSVEGLETQTTKFSLEEDLIFASSTITNENEYAIIMRGSLEEDITYSRDAFNYSVGGENSVLNRTNITLGLGGFITNGVTGYDIIRQSGQADQLIFF